MDFTFHHGAEGDEVSFEIGGLALGLNFLANESVEIVTETVMDVPQNDEKSSFGIALQFIATLPAGK